MELKLKNKQFIIDGQSKMIMAGEVHYYRTKKADWQHILDELKVAGFNAVATYIPWCIHEQEEGDFDLTGKYREQYDLEGFLKLCVENDLYVIARPGPFVMAEMVNDGIPTWVSEKYPDVIPRTWDGKLGTTVHHDYSNPGFIESAEKWIKEISTLLQETCLEKLISIQIDNEIGMLSWVSNCPDLTVSVIREFVNYLKETNKIDNYNLDFTNEDAIIEAFRSPKDEYVVQFHEDYGDYSRVRFKDYVLKIVNWYETTGINDMLYAINIHGTGAGKLYGYPIGLSQLYKIYEEDERFYSGSDIYLKDFNIPEINDTTLVDIFTEALNNENQPLSSLEYSASNADFGFSFEGRHRAAGFNLRTRYMLGENNKLFNYYLFSGGFNDYMNKPLNNGTDRIATTGEYHGFGVPILPTGKRNYSFDKVSEVANLITNMSDVLSPMLQEKDNVTVAFIPDYFKTEFCYDNPIIKKRNQNIERFRIDAMSNNIIRALKMLGYQISASNIQDQEIDVNKVLLLSSTSYMSANVQNKVVEFLKAGGRLYLTGLIPEFDMLGEKCEILKSFLKIRHLDYKLKGHYEAVMHKGCMEGMISSFSYDVHPVACERNFETLLELYAGKLPTAIHINDDINVVCLFNHYRCDLDFFSKICELLGVNKNLEIIQPLNGIVANLMKNEEQQFVNVVNLDDVNYKYNIKINNEQLFSEDIGIDSLEGVLIPVNVKLGEVVVKLASTEIFKYNNEEIAFRLVSGRTEIELITDKELNTESAFTEVIKTENGYKILKTDRLFSEEFLVIKIK